MCGFTGYYNFNYKPIEYLTLKEMTDVQKHRGPDSQGIIGFSFRNKDISSNEKQLKNQAFEGGIGFNRLSILDLSENGSQPMVHENKNIIVAYNGEVYNAFSLKSRYLNDNKLFKSETDTEIILNLYATYGIDWLLQKVKGMFSFVIVDLKKEKLYFARDHFGIKPAYYYINGNIFMFSSEIKSFLSHPEYNSTLNDEVMDEQFLFGYCAGKNTLLKNTYQVNPGEYLELSKGKIKSKIYFRNSYRQKNEINITDAIYEVEDRIKKSVEEQLLSDVEVGCQLSGGLDSSLITYFSREHFDAKLETFSIIFDQSNISEESWIKEVCKQTKSISNLYLFKEDYFIDNLFSGSWHLDQPINLHNTLAIKFLGENISKKLKVVLSGEGADEIFAGYQRYFELAYRQKYINVLNKFSSLPMFGKTLKNKFKLGDNFRDYVIFSSTHSSDNIFKIKPDLTLSSAIENRRELFYETGNNLKDAITYDSKTFLVDLLNRQDKMMMAHSVENRVPYLDLDLVNYVRTLPNDLLIKNLDSWTNYNKANNYSKHILKLLCAKKFNKKFVYRKKSGFPLPFYSILYKKRMFDLVNDLVIPGIKNRGLFNHSSFKKMLLNNKTNPINSDLKILWSCISFEIWSQLFLDRKKF